MQMPFSSSDSITLAASVCLFVFSGTKPPLNFGHEPFYRPLYLTASQGTVECGFTRSTLAICQAKLWWIRVPADKVLIVFSPVY